MDSSNQELKHRTATDEPIKDDNNVTTSTRHKRPATAKRGIRSLAIALALPISLTLAEISLLGPSRGYGVSSSYKPFWFPPLLALHLALLLYSALMGASAWLVWAQGGFHRDTTAVALYTAQLVLSLAWAPLVSSAPSVGMVVGIATVGLVGGCYQRFGKLNRTAGKLVMPCLVWAGFLALVNLRLMYL